MLIKFWPLPIHVASVSRRGKWVEYRSWFVHFGPWAVPEEPAPGYGYVPEFN